MQIEERIHGDVGVVCLRGSLVEEEDGLALERKLASLTGDNVTSIVIDLGGLHSLNSLGLASLLRAGGSVRRRGGTIRLAELDRRLGNLLAKSRLVRSFETYETVGRALANAAG